MTQRSRSLDQALAELETGADDRISRHFVEVISADEPPLSSERQV